MNNFASTVHILGRYPELAANADFICWLRNYGGDIWHETHPNSEGEITVVVQSPNRLNLFAALLLRDLKGAEEEGRFEHKVIRTAPLDVTKSKTNSSLAAKIVTEETGTTTAEIHALRPVINFRSAKPQVMWEVEIKKENQLEIFRVNSPDDLTPTDSIKIKKPEKPSPQAGINPMDSTNPFINDWLAENECHHVSAWRPMAQQAAGGAATPAQKAAAVFNFVRRSMAYDATITHIWTFTWSDNLTANVNRWKGICDEWSVVQITLLRALGIPAVLKFMGWHYSGSPGAHACLEWSDNGIWRHMDALYNAFDDRTVYRQRGAYNITVMDASFPKDSRFNGTIPGWGAVDQAGDERFYPYGDFMINPAYPGNQRPGYSY